MADERQHSSIVVDGVEQAPSRAMLYPVGFSEDDFKKPQIGIASTWSMITPCNMHINDLAEHCTLSLCTAVCHHNEWPIRCALWNHG